MKLRQIIILLSFLLLIWGGASLRLAAAASGFALNQSNEAGGDALLEAYVQAVAREVRATWPKVKEIWPEAEFDRIALVLTDDDLGWRITPAGTIALAATDIAALFKPQAKFSFQIHEGQDAIVLSLVGERKFFHALASHPLPPGVSTAMFTGGVAYDQRKVMARLRDSHPELAKVQSPTAPNGVTQSFALGVHEALHHYVQKSWDRRPLPKGAGMRSDPFPAPVGPRVCRALILENLYRAFLEPDNRATYLSAAAYWNQVWKGSHAADYEATWYTDVVEGTARYFDTAMQSAAMVATDPARSANDCRIASLALTDDRESPVGPNPRMLRPSRSAESYSLGAVAGLLADEMGLDWRKKTAEFVRPVDIVLEKIMPVPQSPRPDMVSAIEPVLRDMEAKVAGPLQAFVARLKEPRSDDLLILVDAQKTGSFSHTGSFTTDGLPENTILVVGETGDCALEDGKVALRKAMIAYTPNESLSFVHKGKPLILALVPLQSVQAADGRIRITTDEFTVDAKESKSSRTTYLGRAAILIQ